MSLNEFRLERDSMGELRVPASALWGAQTQRAVQNFPISGLHMPRGFIRGLGLVKWAAAGANLELGGLDKVRAFAIQRAALEVADGRHDAQFPVDVFQTGSGTSSNMNANEVIAHLATQYAGYAGGTVVHPNDDVNRSQSSNDVVPTVIHLSAALAIAEQLLPALKELSETIGRKAADVGDTVKTGRTHLMDAMPLTLAQELGGWRAQVDDAIARLQSCRPRLHSLAQGGTAVGTGINAPPQFAASFAALLSKQTGLDLRPSRDFFASLGSQDTAVEVSGQLRTLAVSLMKIANDLRWMNSGPLGRAGRNRVAGTAAGQQHHAGQGQPRRPGGGRDGRRPGHRQRRHDHGCRPVGQFPAERDVAGDSVQPAAEHRAAGQRLARAGPKRDRWIYRQRAADRGGARAQPDAGDRAESGHRL